MPCPHIKSCELYPLFRSDGLLLIWKMKYCDAAFSDCARFKRSCAAEKVPANLLPNGKYLGAPLKDG